MKQRRCEGCQRVLSYAHTLRLWSSSTHSTRRRKSPGTSGSTANPHRRFNLHFYCIYFLLLQIDGYQFGQHWVNVVLYCGICVSIGLDFLDHAVGVCLGVLLHTVGSIAAHNSFFSQILRAAVGGIPPLLLLQCLRFQPLSRASLHCFHVWLDTPLHSAQWGKCMHNSNCFSSRIKQNRTQHLFLPPFASPWSRSQH